MINFKEELNAEQHKVIQQGDGPCLVLAGAGSGKTRTITYRVAHLLEQGVEPSEILLVTFTNKAAREMMTRVQEITGGDKRLPWSGTFHHVAYRILKKYAPLLGYTSSFSILDSSDSRDLMKICVKGEGIDRKERRFPSPRVIQSIISYARNAETTVADVLEVQHPKWIDLADTIARIADEYAKRKREANVMDFDDLLVNLYLLLLKHEKTRVKFATQFKYVLVDEYQDTNKIQASIIRLMSSKHKNVLVVGDDAQSIYSFRAADIQNILSFEDQHENAQVFRLETNYRSTPNILDVANEVISYNKRQYTKELKSIRDGFTKPEVHAFADASEEAEFIAERILELREEGVGMTSMAVLFRAAFHSQALEMELTKRDIPYDFRGGTRFFERAHIKDVLAYLRIIANPGDAIAWSRVLNMQVGIGPASADKIIRALSTVIPSEARNPSAPKTQKVEENKPLTSENIKSLGSLLSARGQVGWGDFLQIYEDMERVEVSVSNLIRAIIESKYAEYLESEHPDYRDRIQDLEQLALFAEREGDLTKFLAEASLQESYTAAHARDNSADDEKIVLSTIHQAKGLEWEAVFVLHMAAGQFPNDRATHEQDGLEEERRLFYVAVTRAKKYLYLTYPLMGGFRSVLQGPSMFLEEVDVDLLDKHSFDLGGGSAWTDPSDDVDDITYEPDEDSRPMTSFLMDI